MSNIIYTNKSDIEKDLKEITKSYSNVCILVDENTKKYCLSLLFNTSFKIIEIKSGEEEKNLETCQFIWSKMTDLNLDRKSLLINLGGGVIGDMGGFCASTYKRGIDFIQIPTTLLSQVDASIGGKLGIDFNIGNDIFKNHIGVFNTAKYILINPHFLLTLDTREYKSGFAEVIKHCLITDKSKWNEIRKDIHTDLIKHSINIKENITLKDPFETGLRKILNFGHTIGHAVESYFLMTPKKLLHGEALVVGMLCEAYLSVKKEFISLNDFKDIEKYLLFLYGKIEINVADLDKIIDLTIQDKKNENEKIMFSLLESIGKGNYNIEITKDEIKEALKFYISI